MCKVYFTEDTPAILSKAGSNSNLSVLSIDSTPAPPAAEAHDTSDSSNLSDAGDLLEECIQKGIAKVTTTKPQNTYKNKVQKANSAKKKLATTRYTRVVYLLF